MAGFTERIKQVAIPLDQMVVIGSGLLDAWGLRDADDIDLVVSQRVFDELRATGEFSEGQRDGSAYLEKDQLEIWTDWKEGLNFEQIAALALTIDGVMFVNPAVLIARKAVRGTDKDLRDIELIATYLQTHVTDN